MIIQESIRTDHVIDKSTHSLSNVSLMVVSDVRNLVDQSCDTVSRDDGCCQLMDYSMFQLEFGARLQRDVIILVRLMSVLQRHYLQLKYHNYNDFSIPFTKDITSFE